MFAGWSRFDKPIVCLAPMDGVTNTAFRQIVRKVAPEVILFSEFTNVDGILHSDRVRQRLDYDPCEHPFFMQIFGNNPDSFAKVAPLLEERGVMGIDINMGCPSKRIVNSQHGSALMQNPDQACRIIEAVRKACSLEVSVKTRLGWTDANELIPFGKRLESSGVSLLTIHGRTYRQAFKGEADWNPIHHLKTHLEIPVLGNGDVLDYNDGMRKMKNLDGFMIGRKAIGNPWVFRDQRTFAPPSLSERVDIGMEHFHLLLKIKPEAIALKEIRRYLGEYVRDIPHAREWRGRVMESANTREFVRAMETIKSLDLSELAEAC